jgi:predicted AAA+ superfamily ATPase
VALLGPRQCGKTTLARQLAGASQSTYFDLEDPIDLARLSEPMTALESLRGLIVIDEVQRHPDLLPILRVLLDRKPIRARFLILGSASPKSLRQSSESLAGRIAIVEMAGFTLEELNIQVAYGTAQSSGDSWARLIRPSSAISTLYPARSSCACSSPGTRTSVSGWSNRRRSTFGILDSCIPCSE